MPKPPGGYLDMRSQDGGLFNILRCFFSHDALIVGLQLGGCLSRKIIVVIFSDNSLRIHAECFAKRLVHIYPLRIFDKRLAFDRIHQGLKQIVWVFQCFGGCMMSIFFMLASPARFSQFVGPAIRPVSLFLQAFSRVFFSCSREASAISKVFTHWANCS